MNDTKPRQPKRDPKFDEDLRENPEGVNTFEGDVENDTTPVGSVPEGKLGRTNK